MLRSLGAMVCSAIAALVLASCASSPQQAAVGTTCYSDANRPADVYTKALVEDSYRPNAERGDASAQYDLATAYFLGSGAPQDDAQAAHWYQAAADQGHGRAMYYLAALYETGRAGPPNPIRAAQLYKTAADRGDLRAPACLGLYYARGIGVSKDPVRAAMWYEVATARTFREPAGYAGLKRQLTAAQLAEARRMAQDWKPIETAAGLTAPVAPGTAVRAGSGFVLSPQGDVLTNNHVVAGCASIRVSDGERDGGPARLVAADGENDLALLSTMLPVGAVAGFRGNGEIRPGEVVMAVGYPLADLLGNREGNVSTGIVSALSGPKGDPRYLRMTAPIQQGNSGGPILDKDGNIVGVVVGTGEAMREAGLVGALPATVSFGIKESVVRQFLDDHGVAYRRSDAGSAGEMADVAAAGRRIAVYVECRD